MVRDVMQNHLTEMLLLVAMELPQNSGNISEVLACKQRLLQQIQPLTNRALLLGQYAAYQNECLSDTRINQCREYTPTFGAAALAINNPRWSGVPFVLMSGKKLDEKFSYIRVVFKEGRYCVRKENSACRSASPRQLIFHIATGDLQQPIMVTASDSLPSIVRTDGWMVGHLQEGDFFGEAISSSHQLLPTDAVDLEAYTRLLEAVLGGYRHLFIDSGSLLASWRVWDTIVKTEGKRKPRLYQGGEDGIDVLDFEVVSNTQLQFALRDKQKPVGEIEIEVPGVGVDSLPAMAQIPGEFCNAQLVCDTTDSIITKLANDIQTVAEASIAERGVFHLALSGGISPQGVLERLVDHHLTFPWTQTHVWLVDERCVPLDDSASNFHMIHRTLLNHINLPYLNMHPMPVLLSDDPCQSNDVGDKLYEAGIRRQVLNASMDFILLGVGKDGHTASLFPNHTETEEPEKLVTYSTGGPKDTQKRMTLTLTAVNQARHVAILLLGKGKHKVVSRLLQEEELTVNEYPVTGVKPKTGVLVWYIDRPAFFGNV